MINQSHPEPEERAAGQKNKIFPCDEKLRAELLAMRAENPALWTDRKLAEGTGYSSSVFFQYTRPDGNRYSGTVSAVEAKLREFIRDHRLMLDIDVPTIEWDGTSQITNAIEDIRTAKRIGVVIGAPGIGKSRGIDLYCQTHALAISLHAWAGECNKSAVAGCLFEAAGIDRGAKGENDAQTLARVLHNSSRPLLIDDAHKLTCQSLQLLYDLRDKTGLPIVLFGDDRLIAKLRNDPQRLRRTGIVYRLKLKDPGKLVDHHIQTLIRDGLAELPQLRKLCLQIAAQAGHFGSVEMELKLAARLKQGAPDWTWTRAVEAAHTRLIRDYALKGALN